MAFFDWNRDGKKDGLDNYLEYRIFKDCFEDDDDNDEALDLDDDFEEYDEYIDKLNIKRHKDGAQ